jgi:predicted  nucleic acid-binding Zn-ribbon protein
MRLQTRKACTEQARAMSILRDQVSDLKAEKRELTDANARLARRLDEAEEALTACTGSVVEAHRELVAERDRLQAELDAVRKDRDGIRQQLDHALGYGAEELTAIEAGKTTAVEKASAAS